MSSSARDWMAAHAPRPWSPGARASAPLSPDKQTAFKHTKRYGAAKCQPGPSRPRVQQSATPHGVKDVNWHAAMHAWHSFPAMHLMLINAAPMTASHKAVLSHLLFYQETNEPRVHIA